MTARPLFHLLWRTWSLFIFMVLTILFSTTTALAFRTATKQLQYHHISSTALRLSAGEDDGDDDEQGPEWGGDGALGKPSYSNNALFNFHMMTQAQKIRDYSAMDTFVDTESLWNLAWHDSFVRNGLSDFVPPLTDTLNVLVVGGGDGGDGSLLGDSSIQQASDTVIVPAITADSAEAIAEEVVMNESTSSEELKQQDSSCSFLAAVFDDSNENIDNKIDEMYDCIMDQGLMADLLGDPNNKGNTEGIGRLLWEAVKRIRENGVYVANTPPMNSDTKEYLIGLGQLLGLQWEFDLDGISDSNMCVSVARKYGQIPSKGWQSFRKMWLDEGTKGPLWTFK